MNHYLPELCSSCNGVSFADCRSCDGCSAGMVLVGDSVCLKVTCDSGCGSCVEAGVNIVGGQYSSIAIVWESAGICSVVPEPVEK